MFTVHFFHLDPLATSQQELYAMAEKNGVTLKGVDWPQDVANEWEAMKSFCEAQPLAWLLPLSSCPTGPQDDIVITALSARQTASYVLSIPRQLHDQERILQVAYGADIVADRLAAQYLKDVRPDLILSPPPVMEKASVHAWPYRLNTKAAISIPLNHREFPPPAGAGVWAWVTPKDAIALRRLLRMHHHPEVAQLTNIERDLQARFDQAGISVAGIYSEYNDQGHIQLWMAWQENPEESIRRCSLSSTSYLNLAELAWEKTGLTFDTNINIRS